MTLFLTPVLYCVALVESNEYMKGIGKKKKNQDYVWLHLF